MKHTLSLLSTAVISATMLLPVTLPADASTPAKCGDRDSLIKLLKERYKEVPVGLGISQKSTEAFEVFASESGTWTVVMTMSNGMTCVMAAGHSWQNIPFKVAGPVT